MRPVRSRFLTSLCALALLGPACSRSDKARAEKAAPSAEAAVTAQPAKAEAAPKVDPAKLLEEEKARGKAFLARAAQEKGAVKTRSGMVFVSLKKGTGPSAAKATSVRLGHVSKLIDDRVFDHASSIDVDIEGVIPCWQEGIKLMNVGGSARLICPPELAFEDRGADGIFPPGSTMVYELDLRAIIK